VTAQVTSVPALITTSSAIVIATGPPDQDSLSLSASVLNPRGWDLDGTDVTLTARLADRFNNKIQDGTAISFMTELGSIVGSCTTVNGACSTTWTSQAPRIVATDLSGLGRTTIIATVEGEESFIDVDGDGVYSDADTGLFTDLPEAYRDDNEDGAFNSGETFIDFDGSLSWNDVSTMYNGSGCTNTTVGAGGCDPVDSITVRDSIVLVMAEDQPAITAIGTNGSTNNLCATQAECLVTTGGYPGRYPGSLSLVLGGAPDGAVGSVTFTIAGINNEQVLPAGSTINFGVTNGKITGGASHTVTSTNANPATGSGVTRYTVYLKADTTPSNDGVLNISANVAGSTWSFPPIDIDDSAAPAVEYFVSGNITGTAFPASTSLNLLNNGGDAISVPASGAAFAFPTGLLDGDNYAVTVVNNTTGLTCVVTGGSSANGSGSIAAADVTNIDVACN
ncbi:MAG: hypothetical protein OEM07_03730, partial [Gammaproteobacteria bacterium]|nr:hypothetical protein [Gammaproteobacteria bacterium]